jgi:uracil phosphoribosyltransferase
MTDHVTHVTHPLVQHKLTLMRKKDSCWPMRSRVDCQ